MTNEVTQEIIDEFKERLKLSDDEDENLKRILEASIQDLIVKCGQFEIISNLRFKELVFERSRFVYNDALEAFDKLYLSQINSLGFEALMLEGVPDNEGL